MSLGRGPHIQRSAYVKIKEGLGGGGSVRKRIKTTVKSTHPNSIHVEYSVLDTQYL